MVEVGKTPPSSGSSQNKQESEIGKSGGLGKSGGHTFTPKESSSFFSRLFSSKSTLPTAQMDEKSYKIVLGSEKKEGFWKGFFSRLFGSPVKVAVFETFTKQHRINDVSAALISLQSWVDKKDDVEKTVKKDVQTRITAFLKDKNATSLDLKGLSKSNWQSSSEIRGIFQEQERFITLKELDVSGAKISASMLFTKNMSTMFPNVESIKNPLEQSSIKSLIQMTKQIPGLKQIDISERSTDSKKPFLDPNSLGELKYTTRKDDRTGKQMLSASGIYERQ